MEQQQQQYKLNKLRNNFTDHLYKWMKIEFSDICSDGDVIINRILDRLKDGLDQERDDLEYIEYVYDAYNKKYLRGDRADPFRWIQ